MMLHIHSVTRLIILYCSACPVILSLFDSQAITFHRRLESMSADPKVIVATNINPRMVGGIYVYLIMVQQLYCIKSSKIMPKIDVH